MDVASVALVVATLCVSFGWQPSQEDPQAYEVLMQVEPELVDMLHGSRASGRQIPIESYVPAEVTPIRNIRVTVGTGELPRKSIAAKGNIETPAGRIVRGQEASPLEHTARFQSDDGWSGDRYTPTTTGDNRQFDQRGATIGVEPIRTAQASPWTLDSAQQAATNAGNSLRNSANSGIQQTNQQLSQGGQQLLDGAQSASRDFGQQLQSMSGFGSQPSSTSTSSSSQSGWPAPPPLASPQSTTQPPLSSAPANRTTTPAVWSSIQPQLAPPRLMTPPLANNVRVASNPSAGRASSGPSFPPPPTSMAPPLHSVLADPAANSDRSGEQDWSSVWGTGSGSNTATSDSDAGVGLEHVPPRTRTTSTPAPAIVTANPNPVSQVDDRYRQSTAGTPATNSAADAWANFGKPHNSGFDSDPPQSQPPAATAPQNQPFVQQGPLNQPAIATQPPATQQTQLATGGEEVPWKPLLAVSLALAGSIGANIFLGMSYAEARHRYHALVAKTTHSFQKAAGIAA